MTLRLFASQIDRLCDGTQHIKNGWTAERRAEVVIDGEIVHEDSSQAAPFDLWEAVPYQAFRRRYMLGADS